jgi:hypothetical protein
LLIEYKTKVTSRLGALLTLLVLTTAASALRLDSILATLALAVSVAAAAAVTIVVAIAHRRVQAVTSISTLATVRSLATSSVLVGAEATRGPLRQRVVVALAAALASAQTPRLPALDRSATLYVHEHSLAIDLLAVGSLVCSLNI